VAQQAAQRKVEKYRDAFPNYCVQPIAVENLGAMNSSAVDFINTLGRRISSVSGEDKEIICLPLYNSWPSEITAVQTIRPRL